MSPFRPDRRRRGPDPYLGYKMLSFVVGAVLGIAGMATGRSWLIFAAAGVLAVGLLLRFLPGSRPDGDADADADAVADADAAANVGDEEA